MSIWSRILDALSALRAGENLSAVFGRLRSDPERRIGFTIAVIGLGAKMAKADGVVTRDEVTAFREVFHIAPEDEVSAGRVFNMARTDISGYEDYARRVKAMYGTQCQPLVHLLDGLFYIAVADGTYHPNEDRFLHKVAEIFEISERAFRSMRARYVPDAERDPYAILGVEPDMELSDIKSAYRKLVRDTHPDKMVALGVPKEALKLATSRLAEVNDAWDTISAERS
jgi:DnaJ like chaperone protein